MSKSIKRVVFILAVIAFCVVYGLVVMELEGLSFTAKASELHVAVDNYVVDEDDKDDEDHNMTVLICHDHALFAKTTAEYRDKKLSKEKVKKNIHELIKAHPETAMTPKDEAEMDTVVDWVYSKPLTTPPDIFRAFMKNCLHPHAA